ncbi:HAMP domain-containing sensor histidine kinase [Paenibacillus sp. FSL L8-0463]|uniref:HAMP domain-containing sensor histidine kinase n=1 Tax=Paenibacillus sp. FSL L8-0463 TaxID=2954687 RepID=UPI003119632B
MKKRFSNLWFAFVMLVFMIMLSSAVFMMTIIFVIKRFTIIEPGQFHAFGFLAAVLLTGILTGTLITAVIGQKILLPINRLREATKEVAKGNFNVQLYENIKIEEFREMAKDFNKMVQELQGIETLRTDFVTNVSHEFKTPITAIEGYAALLQNSDLPAEEREEYAGKIISSTRQLSMLTNNILKLSKLENQEIIIEKTEFSLDEQIRQALLLLEPQWSGKQLDLEIQLAETGFYGSEELLMQVWINILGNAVKFSREYGNLSVTLTESPQNVSVEITDTGIGMTPEVQRHIFEKFYQGDKARASYGNGLGLPLAKRIVDLCGGRIIVSSKPGQGSTFLIELPRE